VHKRCAALVPLDSPLSILVFSGKVLAALARVQVVSANDPAAQPGTTTTSSSGSSSSSSSPNTGSDPATHYSLQLMDNNKGESSQTHGNDGNHDGEDTVIQVAQAVHNLKLSHATVPEDNDHYSVGEKHGAAAGGGCVAKINIL
jgi:hypothetical protein